MADTQVRFDPKRTADDGIECRPSTKYSTENQTEAIARYAAQRSMTIVRTYADEGKSGLRVDGREALQRLISDVESGRAELEAISSSTSAVGDANLRNEPNGAVAARLSQSSDGH